MGAAIHLIQYCFINNWSTLLYTLVASDKLFLSIEKRVLKIFYIHVLNIAKFWLYVLMNNCHLSNIKKLKKKKKKTLIRRVFLFTKLRKSFVDVDSSFYVCKMMKIHPKNPLITSLIFILNFKKIG
jgi:hypothetical protein